MDSLAALRLQIEWGADEALDDSPRAQFRPAPAIPAMSSPVVPSPTPSRMAPAAARGQLVAASAGTLADLQTALETFDGCPLRATATTTVRPDGNPSARTILIAEAPTSDDDRTGIAFAGSSGQTLDRILGSIGLDRSVLLLTHLVPWRPPGGRAPADTELHACLPFLLRLLQLVRPERLVLLGSASVRMLTSSNDSLRRLRGRWLQAHPPGFDAPLAAIAMFPFDQWLRNPAAKRDCWADLVALRLSMQPNP